VWFAAGWLRRRKFSYWLGFIPSERITTSTAQRMLCGFFVQKKSKGPRFRSAALMKIRLNPIQSAKL
jgi:hypothetical protein